MNTQLFTYTLHLADNALILGQRNAEWCGHGPALEQDIAITNISLDLIGQARNLYAYAATLYNDADKAGQAAFDKLLPRPWKAFNRPLEEDDLAMLREERQFRNLLLTELPRRDWAQTVLRQFLFSAFQFLQYEALQATACPQLAAIAEKSIKEVAYHQRWSGEWVIRLGDGTEESRTRIERALADQWPFTGEMFSTASYELVDCATLRDRWMQKVTDVFAEATLDIPKSGWAQQGGKDGVHTESLGFLLAEMQSLPRTYPNATW
ncbi:MAG: phenylacetic acid degradation protein [Flaviaesturariibacter sp.]|nr:phenylacetic acid degradation protein [Flaviaesturariibacter sp.]